MKRVTRRHIKAWLAPMRRCFAEIKSGEVDCIRGYPVTRLSGDDDYARIDACINGFIGLLERLCPEISVKALQRIEKKLAAGAPVTIEEVDGALRMLNQCENALIKHSREVIKDAVLTEQILIELDELDIREAA